jgi:3-methyladenine DNA glycosylase AlkD/uncharacterized protein (DUF302 family)
MICLMRSSSDSPGVRVSGLNGLCQEGTHHQPVFGMKINDILKQLKSMANPEAVKGMARFGINPEKALGISIPELRRLAKQIGKDHSLAGQLWSSDIHDARILAGMVDDPEQVTGSQMEKWVNDFDSWDLCDQCCNNLFYKTGFAYPKALEWSARRAEFVKRAGFVMMAVLAVHDKTADDEPFKQFFPIIKRESTDERNFVKKAVNWALRQIGKRNRALNQVAIDVGKEIKTINSRAARWIAGGALRELTNDKVQKRLHRLIFVGIILLVSASVTWADTGFISVKSNHSVKETADRLEKVLKQKGMTVFNRINHAAGAKRVDKVLRPTELIIFGNPKVGAPLMQCSQTVGLDLPQKALIWEDEAGLVWFTYNAPRYLDRRHGLAKCGPVLKKIENALRNFAVAATMP